jgi:hypothetical protein
MTAASPYSMNTDRYCTIGLVLLIIVSGLLRAPGLFYGFPEIVLWDEVTYSIEALEMLEEGSLDPGEYRHGNFTHYFFAAVFSPLYFMGRWTGLYPEGQPATPWHFLLLGRILCLLCSLLGLWLIYRIGRRLFGPPAGLIAAFFMAIHPITFHYGQIAKPDIFVQTISLAAALLFLRIYSNRSSKTFIIAGALAGIGVSTKYSMVVFFPCILGLFLFMRMEDHKMNRKSGLSWTDLGISLSVAVLVGTFFNIFILINLQEALKQLELQYNITVLGKHVLAPSLPELDPWSVATQQIPHGFGWPIALFAMIGWAAWAFRDWRSWLMVSIYPIFHYMLVNRWQFAFPRELMPIIPPLCLGAAWVIVEGYNRGIEKLGARWKRPLAVGIGILCLLSLAAPVQKIYQKQKRILAGNSKVLAKRWMEENLPKDAKIAVDGFVLPEMTVDPRYHFSYIMGYHPYRYYVQQGTEYLVKSRIHPAALAARPEVAANEAEIEEKAVLLKEWQILDLEIEGPNLAIYRVPENTEKPAIKKP